MSESKKPRVIKVKNHNILLDEEDYSFISRFKWHIKKDKNTYYAYTNIYIANKNTSVSIHRLLTQLRNCTIDHKNRNGLDNRKENLRFCTAKQNSYNRVRKNKFGFRGVYLPKRSKTFYFQIQKDGKKIHSGGYKTAKDAAIAYDKINRELHGEFGIRNFEK